MAVNTRVVLAAVAAAVVAGHGLTMVVAKPGTWDGVNPDATPPDRHHTPSPVIFPEQSLPIRMLHGLHLKLQLQCFNCHEDAEGSTRAADDLLPPGTSCDLCHALTEPNAATATPKAACTTCHLGAKDVTLPDGLNPHEAKPDELPAEARPPATHMPAPNLKFNHKVHIARKIECTTCHEGMDDIAVATRENALPLMEKCLECHDGKQAPKECGTCHITKPDNRVVTQYATGTLAPKGYYFSDDHAAPDWAKSHEIPAKANEETCLSCHTKKECTDCHNGIVRPMKLHPANWVLLHPTTARKNSLECQSCHREQSFCLDCHQRSRLSDLPPNDNPSVMVHPQGWVNNIVAGQAPGPNHHKWQAQRNIRACASCHQENTCIKCHSARDVPGFGVTPKFNKVNPHPADFSSRCRTMLSANSGMCEKCHESNDIHLMRCR